MKLNQAIFNSVIISLLFISCSKKDRDINNSAKEIQEAWNSNPNNNGKMSDETAHELAKRFYEHDVEGKSNEQVDNKIPEKQDQPASSVIANEEPKDAESQFSLGLKYENGDGVEQNFAEAAKWFRKAAEQGNLKAQVSLGTLYEFGHGVSQDDAEAVTWYRKATEQGDADGQSKLATCYASGVGVEKDDVEAMTLARKAAKQENARGQRLLGIFYHQGKTVPKDDVKAVKWLQKAAEQGDHDAQLVLGLMYLKGWGVSEDPIEATAWFMLANEGGNSQAAKLLDQLKDTPQALAVGRARALKLLEEIQARVDAITPSPASIVQPPPKLRMQHVFSENNAP